MTSSRMASAASSLSNRGSFERGLMGPADAVASPSLSLCDSSVPLLNSTAVSAAAYMAAARLGDSSDADGDGLLEGDSLWYTTDTWPALLRLLGFASAGWVGSVPVGRDHKVE